MKFLKITLTILILWNFVSCKEKPLSKQNVTISYELRSKSLCSKELIAVVDGKKEIIIKADEKLNLNIQLQDDFNNDGALDILLENRKGCYEKGEGGYLSHEGSSYIAISYDGRKFIRTQEVGKDWDGIIMEMKNNQLHFTIDTAQESRYTFSDYISCDDKEEEFILDGFNFKKTSIQKGAKIPDIKGVTYEGHLEKVSRSKKHVHIDYDIDNDGVEDDFGLDFKKSIKGFDNLYIAFSTLNNQTIPITKRSVKRVGVLASETNGVHDLVLDCNEILKWNGEKYTNKTVDTTENKYRVFAKSGLIIRDEPDGNPIGKFNYGQEITIVEKTKIKKEYYDEKEEQKIEGYWYKTTFTKNNNKEGYVFSGFLANTKYCGIYSNWGPIRISKSNIVLFLHGQCAYTYPLKIINKNELELIWANDMDCVFDSGLDNDFGLKNVPEKGKPFAKYKLEGDSLKVTYYYPEWSKNFPSLFYNSYDLSYEWLTDTWR